MGRNLRVKQHILSPRLNNRVIPYFKFRPEFYFGNVLNFLFFFSEGRFFEFWPMVGPPASVVGFRGSNMGKLQRSRCLRWDMAPKIQSWKKWLWISPEGVMLPDFALRPSFSRFLAPKSPKIGVSTLGGVSDFWAKKRRNFLWGTFQARTGEPGCPGGGGGTPALKWAIFITGFKS